MFSDVWSENAAQFERLMEMNSNPPILYYGFKLLIYEKGLINPLSCDRSSPLGSHFPYLPCQIASRYHHQMGDSSSKHIVSGLPEGHLGSHGLSPRSLESDDFSPPTSSCPTPSRWSQTPTFRLVVSTDIQ